MHRYRSNRRRALRAAAGLVVALAAGAAAAQGYPTKPIRLLVPLAAGSTADIVSRFAGQELSKALGQPVVIENKPGAGGTIAMAELARAAPDGYTLILANIGPFALAPSMMGKPPYDPLKDFTAIGQIVSTYFVAAVPVALPPKSMSEFVAWAKANDGKVNFASGGNASITHLNGELVNMVAGVRMTHVPYKGSAPAVTDLIAGQTQLLIDVGSVLTPQVKAGKLRAIAVTSPERDPQLPDVPTMRESGFAQLETAGWQGLMGPPGMPRDVVVRIATELGKVLARPDVQKKFADAATPVTLRGPDEFAAFVAAENRRWLPVIKASGAKIE